jgi:hypothetical protein
MALQVLFRISWKNQNLWKFVWSKRHHFTPKLKRATVGKCATWTVGTNGTSSNCSMITKLLYIVKDSADETIKGMIVEQHRLTVLRFPGFLTVVSVRRDDGTDARKLFARSKGGYLFNLLSKRHSLN